MIIINYTITIMITIMITLYYNKSNIALESTVKS